LNAPIVVANGTQETPEIQRQRFCSPGFFKPSARLLKKDNHPPKTFPVSFVSQVNGKQPSVALLAGRMVI
jgi:hypothetical protein